VCFNENCIRMNSIIGLYVKERDTWTLFKRGQGRFIKQIGLYF